MGHSDIFLKVELIKEIVGIGLIFAALNISVYAVAVSQFVSGLISLVINAWPNRRLLGYKLSKQLLDILPALLLACLMGACIYPIGLLGLSDWLTLLIQVPLGVVIYVVGSVIFRVDSFSFMLDVLRRLMSRGAEE